MTGTVASIANSAPFHGEKETHAAIFHVLAWVEAVYLLAGPWVLYLVVLYRGTGSHGHSHAPRPGLLIPEAFGLIMLLEYQSIYGRLSRRIRQGGPDLQFLDQIRYLVSLLAAGVPILLIEAIIFSSR